MTNLKMSTIHNGHYHPLYHAGRAVRPDGYDHADLSALRLQAFQRVDCEVTTERIERDNAFVDEQRGDITAFAPMR